MAAHYTHAPGRHERRDVGPYNSAVPTITRGDYIVEEIQLSGGIVFRMTRPPYLDEELFAEKDAAVRRAITLARFYGYRAYFVEGEVWTVLEEEVPPRE